MHFFTMYWRKKCLCVNLQATKSSANHIMLVNYYNQSTTCDSHRVLGPGSYKIIFLHWDSQKAYRIGHSSFTYHMTFWPTSQSMSKILRSSHHQIISIVIGKMGQEFKIKDLGAPPFFLGIHITPLHNGDFFCLSTIISCQCLTRIAVRIFETIKTPNGDQAGIS